jgi:hypothetical protein
VTARASVALGGDSLRNGTRAALVT